MRPLRFGSLFSGIGGLDLGLEAAGMECAWQVEIDPFCRAVLELHWPAVQRYADIREITKETHLEPVDVLCGGFPCQPVSLAGKRQAQDDPRWLWPEFHRIIRMVRPRYVLVENVPGLLSAGFGDVLSDLATCGYDAEWDCVSAASVGAPHLRERIFLVAYPQEHPVGAGLRAGWPGAERRGRPSYSGGEADVADADGERCIPGAADGWRQARVFAGDHDGPSGSSWWSAEPNVGRVAHGVPARVDRLRALGNAVVPQIAEYVGRLIAAHAQASEVAA